MIITKEMIDSEIKGISLRLPKLLHNELKAIAAKKGMTKDQLFLKVIVEGSKKL